MHIVTPPQSEVTLGRIPQRSPGIPGARSKGAAHIWKCIRSAQRKRHPLQDRVRTALQAGRASSRDNAFWGLRAGWPVGDRVTLSRGACCTLDRGGCMASIVPITATLLVKPRASCQLWGGGEKRPRDIRAPSAPQTTNHSIPHSPEYTSTLTCRGSVPPRRLTTSPTTL